METLEQFDRDLFLFLNGLRADWLDPLMYLISQGWFWLPLFGLFIYKLVQAYPGGRNRIIVFGAVALTLGITDAGSNWALKKQVKRYRPTHNIEIKDQVHTVTNFNGEEYRGGLYSFVSGHSANYFGLATILFWLLGKKRSWRWLFLWAALIAYSRIYLGVHYPADLFFGGLLGVLAGSLVGHYTLRIVSP